MMTDLMKFLNTGYDIELEKIRHFQLYPELKPWVGDHYDKQRIFVIGESAYLSKKGESNFHYEDKDWYSKRVAAKDIGDSMDNRKIACYNQDKDGEKYEIGLQGRVGIALTECDFLKATPISGCDTWRYIMFMNFFQKPANKSETSTYDRHKMDICKSNQVLFQVIGALKPHIVVFLGKGMYDNYIDTSVLEEHIHYEWCDHPTGGIYRDTDWWIERGKQRFITFINKYVKSW